MKNRILLILICLSCSTIRAQNLTPKYFNGNIWRYYEATYKNGQLHGLYKEYNAQKEVESEMNYEEGTLSGKAKFFREGQLFSEQEYYADSFLIQLNINRGKEYWNKIRKLIGIIDQGKIDSVIRIDSFQKYLLNCTLEEDELEKNPIDSSYLKMTDEEVADYVNSNTEALDKLDTTNAFEQPYSTQLTHEYKTNVGFDYLVERYQKISIKHGVWKIYDQEGKVIAITEYY